MSMRFVMKRLGSDINSWGNLLGRLGVQAQGLMLYEDWAAFSSHGVLQWT